MHNKTKIILGPPGTVKTTTLLNLVEQELAKGTPPDRIGFFAFTKKAAVEAKERAIKKFKLQDQQLPYFRTLHSLAFNELGLNKSEIMGKNSYKEFAQSFGLDLGYVIDADDMNGSITTDNILINEVNLSRMKCLKLEEHYNQSNLDVSWHALLRTKNALEEFKRKKEVFDFTDMIELFIESGPELKFEVLFIDEAQDLCALQWLMVNKLSKNSKMTYVCGDDDQAIYRWNGADVEHFINMSGEVQTLNKSYRCPRSVQALSNNIISRVKNRRNKQWFGTEEEGKTNYHAYPESVDIQNGEWLILARTNYLLEDLERNVRDLGLIYKKNGVLPISKKLLNAVWSWKKLCDGEEIESSQLRDVYSFISSKVGIEHGHKSLKDIHEQEHFTMNNLVRDHGLLVANRPWDVAFDKIGNRDKEFLRCIERRNKSFYVGEPKINLSTIHGAKGGEADNVMLLTDLSKKSQEAMEQNPDDECRVFYVASTRAKKSLHIVQPQREGGFLI